MIRHFQDSDQEILISIFKQNIPKYFDPSELADFENHLQKNTTPYFTFLENKEIIGGFGYSINENQTGSITWIFFSPNHTGIGSGTEAVQFCHEQMKEQFGVTHFSIRTSQYAYEFSEKFGYATARFEKDYWGEGLDLYEMKRIAD